MVLGIPRSYADEFCPIPALPNGTPVFQKIAGFKFEVVGKLSELSEEKCVFTGFHAKSCRKLSEVVGNYRG